jgi:hypothetical protein
MNISTQHDNMEHLALMEVCLGRFPMHMTRSEEGRRYFYSDGSLRWPDTLDRDSRRHVRKMKTLRVCARIFVLFSFLLADPSGFVGAFLR